MAAIAPSFTAWICNYIASTSYNYLSSRFCGFGLKAKKLITLGTIMYVALILGTPLYTCTIYSHVEP